MLSDLLPKGFPTDVSFVEVSCVGSKVGFDKLRNLVKEKIDRLAMTTASFCCQTLSFVVPN